MIMTRWELDKEIDNLIQQGFSEEQAYCVIACMERGEWDYDENIKASIKRNTTRDTD